MSEGHYIQVHDRPVRFAAARKAPGGVIELMTYGDGAAAVVTLTPAEALALAESLIVQATARLHEIRLEAPEKVAGVFVHA